jgi:hypothetical protein
LAAIWETGGTPPPSGAFMSFPQTRESRTPRSLADFPAVRLRRRTG